MWELILKVFFITSTNVTAGNTSSYNVCPNKIVRQIITTFGDPKPKQLREKKFPFGFDDRSRNLTQNLAEKDTFGVVHDFQWNLARRSERDQ